MTRLSNDELRNTITRYSENAASARERDMHGSAIMFELIVELAKELQEKRFVLPDRRSRRSDREVMSLLQDKANRLNKARAQFSHGMARLEQACAQRTAIDPIELRRLEFEITEKILEAYND